MRDNNFLLTYSFENMEGMHQFGYDWYETEEGMLEDAGWKKETLKEFKISEAFEILSVRDIEIK